MDNAKRIVALNEKVSKIRHSGVSIVSAMHYDH